uniref:Uncharacterized protein n=1 Tax=Ditylenchus dipsaci TaxID=166011 RepID=A0A915DT14_9BILA
MASEDPSGFGSDLVKTLRERIRNCRRQMDIRACQLKIQTKDRLQQLLAEANKKISHFEQLQTRNFNSNSFPFKGKKEPLICQMQPVKSSRFVGNHCHRQAKQVLPTLRKWPKLRRRQVIKKTRSLLLHLRLRRALKLRRKESEYSGVSVQNTFYRHLHKYAMSKAWCMKNTLWRLHA